MEFHVYFVTTDTILRGCDMDYKTRNPVPHPWNDDILTNIREPVPFHRPPCHWSPYEMDAPDFSTVFLVL